MNRSDSLIRSSKRLSRLMLGAHVLWFSVVLMLGAWWGLLVLKQAGRIAELEQAAGMTEAESHARWQRTERMLFWESGTFFVLLVASTGFMSWVYWRDMRRARSLQAFFASVTHELRTPLTSIRLQAESIADNLSGDDSQKHLVKRLLEDTMRLEGQVERTLELARVEGGGPVFVQALEIKPWLERMIRVWRESYAGRAEFIPSIEDLTIQADPTALQVILKNLVENSIRHSKREPVRIEIRASASPEGAVRVSLRDDGEGFAGETRSLGQLFQRGSTSQGTGVGLYLVRVLMGRMGGLFEVESRGSGFGVVLSFQGVSVRTGGGSNG